MDVIKNIIGTPRKRGGRKDFDWDGVPNKKDCQPRNTMRQDEIIQTGGMKEFAYPKGYKTEDTDSTRKFKQSYKQWLEEKNKPKIKPKKSFWRFW